MEAARRVGAACVSAALVATLAASPPAYGHADDGRPVPAADGEVRAAHDDQHGGAEGHLPPRRKNVELVSKLKLKGVVPGRISDVTVFGNYAYLGAFNEPRCSKGGVYIVDIKNLKKPKLVGFVRTGANTYVGEGVQVVRLRTKAFRGDVLMFNNEICGEATRGSVGGATLVDVTNPRKPKKLAAGFGQKSRGSKIAHESHSAFAWQAGSKAYAVLVDNEAVFGDQETGADIFDISNPRKPKKIAGYNLTKRFPKILQKSFGENGWAFLHDMVVKKVKGRQLMLLSYWDGGYVVLDVTKPKKPVYVADSDFKNPDPELRTQTGFVEPSEGNAHYAEFTRDNRYIIGADEDFSAAGTTGSTDDKDLLEATQSTGTPQVAPGQTLSGTAVYVGLACDGGTAVPAAPASGGPYLAVVEDGTCATAQKLPNIEAAGGYAGVIMVNQQGDDRCWWFDHLEAGGGLPTFGVGRSAGYAIFDLRSRYDDEACTTGKGPNTIPADIGARGDVVTVRPYFNGWGYVHLFKNNRGKLTELDTYAIPEAMNPKYASGYGDLSVHEVATSQRSAKIAYLSYYAGGFRVVRISGGKLVEVGSFIDKGGSNFWGVQVFGRKGKEYVAASDRDYGLYIFRYTGRS